MADLLAGLPLWTPLLTIGWTALLLTLAARRLHRLDL
jgi:hypothetical protein